MSESQMQIDLRQYYPNHLRNPRPVRALSLTQPWAQLVVLGAKEYGTRSWHPATTHGPIIAIHASKGYPRWAKDLSREPEFASVLHQHQPLPAGMIVGLVSWGNFFPTDIGRSRVSRQELAFGDWAPGRWAWRFFAPFILKEPIPCRGSLGLWKLPPDIQAQLADAVEATLTPSRDGGGPFVDIDHRPRGSLQPNYTQDLGAGPTAGVGVVPEAGV